MLRRAVATAASTASRTTRMAATAPIPLTSDTFADNKLSAETLEVVNATAPVVAENLDTIVKTFYPRMFKTNPEVLQFFNMSNQRAGRQPRALADSVLAAVGHLNNMPAIMPALELIGHKHCALGVLPEHYQIVHDNFLGAVAEVLGDAVTPEIGAAWSGVLMHVANACIDVERQLYDGVSAREEGWDSRKTMPFVVDRVVEEAEGIRSFYLKRQDGGAAPQYVPGQYATLAINPTEQPLFAPRHYTISSPGAVDNALRVSVRHLTSSDGCPEGATSSWLHANVSEGSVIDIRPPFGMFTRAHAAVPSGATEVFLTAGIGITPAVAMIPSAVEAGNSVKHFHCERNEARHAFKDELKLDGVESHYTYSQGDASKHLKPSDVLAKVGDSDNTHYYVCGPVSFMTDMIKGLKAANVPASRIHYEAFGPQVQL
jgi:nitric oxide dioxygenase